MDASIASFFDDIIRPVFHFFKYAPDIQAQNANEEQYCAAQEPYRNNNTCKTGLGYPAGQRFEEIENTKAKGSKRDQQSDYQCDSQWFVGKGNHHPESKR